MFGRAPKEFHLRLERLASEVGWVVSSIEGDGMYFKDFKVNYLNKNVSQRLYSLIKSNSSNMPGDTHTAFAFNENSLKEAEQESTEESRNIGIASYFIITACLKCRILLKAVHQYPKDKKVKSTVDMSFLNLAVGLSILFPDSHANDATAIVQTQKFGPVRYPTQKARILFDSFPELKNALMKSIIGF